MSSMWNDICFRVRLMWPHQNQHRRNPISMMPLRKSLYSPLVAKGSHQCQTWWERTARMSSIYRARIWISWPEASLNQEITEKGQTEKPSREKHLKCPHCERSSGYQSTLNNHIRTHTKEKPFCCSRCGYSAAQRTTLNRHKVYHEKRVNFSASIVPTQVTKNIYF